jgi:hypothetical protein
MPAFQADLQSDSRRKGRGCRAGVDFARIVEASTSPKFKPGDQLGPERSIGSYS